MFESHLKPPVSFPTLTGSIVTFNSQYALPLKSHKIALTATQSGSGTPSPDNVRTINGYSAIGVSASSKNLVSWEHLNLHGWGGSDSTLVRQLNHLSEGTYTVQYKIKVKTLQSGYTSGNYGLLLRAVDNGVNFNITMRADKTNVSEGDIFTYTATFTLTSDYVGKFTSAYYYTGRSPANNSDYCDYYDFQIEKGTTATTYEQPTDFYISIGSTVYGGEYDARTGVLTVTHKIKSIDSSSPINHGEGTNVFYINDFFDMVNDTETTDCNYLIRAEQNYYTITNVQTYMDDKAFTCAVSANRLFIKNTDWSSLSDFLTWLGSGHIDIAIKLSTPIEIQLPPCPIDTLEGENNIWADTGDTTLSYITIG